MFAKVRHIHFVGIGGIGMSGIAEVLLTLGYRVSGSDIKRSAITERLAGLGALTYEGHRGENITGAEVVVTSSAISRDNPEVMAAHAKFIPVIQRAEMLAELMRLKYGIAIAGMHGKTTTTSMVAAVLAAGGLDPTVVVGGRVDAMGSNARLGRSHYLVAEADESDRSFLKLSPILAVVTNIDREHMDCYRNMAAVEQAFIDFIERIPFYGMALLCADDQRTRSVAARVGRRVVTYGFADDATFHIRQKPVSATSGISCYSNFSVSWQNADLGDFELRVPGRHNILNATAAIGVGIGLDIKPKDIRQGLSQFRGVDRRFQLKGSAGGIQVLDDYGHHPTEIRATLAAAKECGYKKIHVIFQPHRYTRTRDLIDEFAAAFGNADSLTVLEIYPASEAPIEGVTGKWLMERVQKESPCETVFASSFSEAISSVSKRARPGDMILTLGAGNVSQLAPQIVEAVEQRLSEAAQTAK